MASDEDDFGAQYEVNSHRAHLFAYVLIAGLIIELAAGIFWYRGIETIVGTAATLLIVIGVWGEIFFGQKARIAGDKQLAQFEARAAEANQKAQEAARELARYRQPRVMSREQMDRVSKAVEPFAGMQFAVCVNPGNPEFESFLRYIELALEKAGWTEIDWRVSAGRTRSGRPTIGTSSSVTGVMVQFNTDDMGTLGGAAMALVVALLAEGFDAMGGPATIQASGIHIMVGPKR
jgi:hypothetical protein